MNAPIYGYEYKPSQKGESAVIRTKFAPTNNLVSKYFPQVETLYDCFQRGLSVSHDDPCFGTRQIDETGKPRDFEWMTYSEVYERVQDFGSGLLEKQLVPKRFELNTIGIFCKNCVEWVLTEHACHCYRLTLIPIYDTLGNDSVSFILSQTELETIVCTAAEALKLASIIEEGHFLKNLIVIDFVSESDKQLLESEGLTVYSFSEIETIGHNNRKNINPPTPDDIHTICYTSGTTGLPKGVCISHRNSISCLSSCLYTGIQGRKEDRYLSYLPLAHVLERLMQSAMIVAGASIAFYQGSTSKILDDIICLKPTVFTSVPRLLNKIYEGINNKIRAKGTFIYSLFQQGIATKTYNLKTYGKFTHYFYDLLFNIIKKATGLDYIRLVISGSAALAPEVLDFLRSFLGCPVVEGYGTSETSGATILQTVNDFSTGNVGGNIGSCEMKLLDVESMEYRVTDREHNSIPCIARGEICVRGYNIATRFYRENKELLDNEGWFHTGDIGVLYENYSIKIIDRLKNFFKLSQGEYVAAEKLELVYTSSSYVSQCYIYGDSSRDYLIAVVVPEEILLCKWWKQTYPNNASFNFEQICNAQETSTFLLNEFSSIHKQSKLRGFERIKKIYIDSIPWTDKNNMLTPTFKLKRNIAKEKYRDVINKLYSS